MTKHIRLNKRSNAVLLLLAIFAMGCVVVVAHDSASASSSVGGGVIGYHKPTGPELTPTTAASAAIKDVREGTAPGNVTLRIAHGSFAQTRVILNGQDGVGGPTSSGSASCFPGLSCTAAEVAQHETERRELEESSTYIIEMKGTSFSPPASRLRKGQTAPTSKVETVIVDAHTGIMEERTIGGVGPKLESLGSVEELTATISSKSTGEVLATASRRVARGDIVGQITGMSGHVQVILSTGNEKISPRDERVVRRARTTAQGKFDIKDVLPGTYEVGVSGSNCGKKITVSPAKTTKATLVCKG